MSGRQNAVQAVLRDSPFQRRWHCHLCGGQTEKVAVLCEVPEGEFKGFRVCERCIAQHDGDSASIDVALRNRAAEIIRDAAREVQTLFDLVGRLEVVDLQAWQAACDAHEQALREQVLRETWQTDSDAIDRPFTGEADHSEPEEVPF
jgi:transcription elongation factor Elf1